MKQLAISTLSAAFGGLLAIVLLFAFASDAQADSYGKTMSKVKKISGLKSELRSIEKTVGIEAREVADAKLGLDKKVTRARVVYEMNNGDTMKIYCDRIRHNRWACRKPI